MPGFVIALLVAFGLVALGGGSATAAGGIDASGQAFLTFDFGGARVERRGPRFGLRLGLQGDRTPGSAEPQPFISAMSLQFDAAGPAALSLGGLTLSLDINPLEGPDAVTARDGSASNELAPLLTAAGPTPWTDGQSLEAQFAPGAGSAEGHGGAGSAHAEDTWVGHWRFRSRPTVAAVTGDGNAAAPAALFTLGSSRTAQAADRAARQIVARGNWRFHPRESARAAPPSSTMDSMARLLLAHQRAIDRAGRNTDPKGGEDRRKRGTVQLARSQGTPFQPAPSAQMRPADRWVFRPVAVQDAQGRGLLPAAFEGNRLRLKSRRMPNR